MKRNHKLAKSISDAAWGELFRCLEYKSDWYGRTFYQIDTFFPSSKTCNRCKFKNNDLKLSDRYWTCPCGAELDRDVNAAEKYQRSRHKRLDEDGALRQKHSRFRVGNRLGNRLGNESIERFNRDKKLAEASIQIESVKQEAPAFMQE